ncbi:MAG TPA: hypothetical protein VK636_05890, partial [Gemmatimonadaceae bacterium]|nr:hypothetical protein [Gemmatimonadaceae bacterium]
LGDMAALAIETRKHTILGVLIANDSTALVIHTDDRSPREAEDLMGPERVMVVHRTGGAWRVDLRRDLLRSGGIWFEVAGCSRR